MSHLEKPPVFVKGVFIFIAVLWGLVVEKFLEIAAAAPQIMEQLKQQEKFGPVDFQKQWLDILQPRLYELAMVAIITVVFAVAVRMHIKSKSTKSGNPSVPGSVVAKAPAKKAGVKKAPVKKAPAKKAAKKPAAKK